MLVSIYIIKNINDLIKKLHKSPVKNLNVIHKRRNIYNKRYE